MVRVPIDPAGLRKKLNTQWMKAAWVGRSERNDAHIGLTHHGIIVGATVRRLPKELSFNLDFIKALQGEVGDPALSQSRLIDLLPLQVPVLAGNDEQPRSDDIGPSI